MKKKLYSGTFAWTAMLPGNCDFSDAKAYKEKLFKAVPDPDRAEPCKLRGERVMISS